MLFCHRTPQHLMRIILLLILLTAMAVVSPAGREARAESPQFVSMDFNDVDIHVFIKFISKLTHKNFVVDSRIKGSVTIVSPEKITVDEAYKVFESVLDINGLSTVDAGNVTKIVPAVRAVSDNVDTRLSTEFNRSSDKIVTRIIGLNYADADELKALLTPLVPKGNIILSYRDSNMLIITAPQTSIERLVKIIETIDIEGIGRKISVLPVKYADADKLVNSLSTIFTEKRQRGKGKTDEAEIVKLVADERTNSIILLASEQESRRIEALVEILDRKVPKGEERIRVYYLEHANAEDMAAVLQEIPQAEGQKKEGQKKAPLLSEDIKITADKATNSLLIIADKDDYPVLEDVISKLDIPRAMVYLECLLMEVNADKGLDLGTEWQVGKTISGNSNVAVAGFGGTGGSGFANTNSLSEGTFPEGFSVGVLGKALEIGGVSFPSIQAVIQAYKNDKDVQILSTPQILTTENKEATITVGKNIAYQTRSAAESSSETYSSYEYKDVGITLKITPSISKDRLVKLDVYQEVTKLDAANTSNADRPTTLKREIETSIIVQDGNSVVIGGLIDESLTTQSGKMPCMGDIPFLGYAFKAESSGSERTNLYVFMTPKVVKNPLEAEAIYKQKNEEINMLRKEEIKLYDDKHTLRSLLSD